MYLITKHITQINGLHLDIPVGVCECREDAIECVDRLNKSISKPEGSFSFEQFIYREIELFKPHDTEQKNIKK